MSTSERLQPASPDRGDKNGHQAPAKAPFREPTPTAPLELPTVPARSFREFMRNRTARIAAGFVGFTAAMGLVALGASRTEAIAGMPVGLGHGGDTSAGSPLAPGAEKPGSPEVQVRNLCDEIPLKDLSKWIGGSEAVFPQGEVTCVGDVPVNAQEEIIGAGTWIFPTGAKYRLYPTMISMFVMKDELPNGGSAFEQNRRSYDEAPHERMVGDTEVTAMSSRGTTLVQVPQPDGTALDVRFSVTLPEGVGGEIDPYPPFHTAELRSLKDLLPQLGLVPTN